MHDDVETAVDRADAVACAGHLLTPDICPAVDDLPLQVGHVNVVVVDDSQVPDARGGEVEQHRRAEAAGADHADSRVAQPSLAFVPDLRQQEVPGVPADLVGRQRRADVDQR